MDLQPSHHLPKTQHFPSLSFSPVIFKNRPTSLAIFSLSLLLSCIIFFTITRPFQPSSLLDIGLFSQILTKHQNSAPKVCDYSYGSWVRDESYPLHKYTEKCPFLDPGFRCQQSGRPDTGYQKWRWQPRACNLPRFNATDFLDRARDGRIVFAGDSIVRNQWESLLCMLAQGVSNQSTIYEEHGSPITKHKGYLSMHFEEYNLTVEYYRVPFLVIIDRPPKDSPKEVRGAIRVDRLHWYSAKWVGADILLFSPGHWWNEDKTLKMGNYFQEGGAVNTTIDVKEAFGKSLITLMSWVLQSLKPEQSYIFFRSYSPVHYRNGTWDEGGHCHTFVSPEMDLTKLESEPLNNLQISEMIKKMEDAQIKAQFINITYLTELRKDGHPSIHREPGTPETAPQDCSHWCLPGVPDTWNELLYAHLLSKQYRTRLKTK
ncbi:protein trichome birefringence-like 9 [Coffea arabica]|uniref:Protein trichome birefringence-like 9 n=1 Tax=Coffea arabica TaxID=13443 RepID=A0ABM4UMF9_COFAR